MSAERVLVIDTDPGVDDALALALAYATPGAEVPLVTTVGGNIGLAGVTENAGLLLGLLDPGAHTTLARGAARPLRRAPLDAVHVHGFDGIGGARRLLREGGVEPRPARPNAPARLVAAAHEYGERLTIVALGPLTNIARAVMRDRRAMTRIGRLVVMGGAVRHAGNVTPAAEFNFHADPHAAAEVLAAGMPVTLVSLDVTEQVRLQAGAIRDALKGRRDLFARACRQMTKSLAGRGGAGMAMHDPLAVAVALRPGLVRTEVVPLSVVTEPGPTAGMSLEDARAHENRTLEGAPVEVAFGVDAGAALEFFLEHAFDQPRGTAPQAVPDDAVCVLGGANIDLVVKADVLPRAGETVRGEDLVQAEGGKGANQAVAARRAGAAVRFIGMVGDDELGTRLRHKLDGLGIEVSGLGADRRPTGVALIAVDRHGQNQISVAPGANDALTVKRVEAQADAIRACRVLVAQFESPMPAVSAAFRIAHSAGVLTLLNPAPARTVPHELAARVGVLVANEIEAQSLVGQPVRTVPEVRRALDALRALGFARPVITLGRRGAMFHDGRRIGRVKGLAVESVDATAAGDTFVGYLAAALAAGDPLAGAIALANRAAAITVTRMGAQPSIPKRAEVNRLRAD